MSHRRSLAYGLDKKKDEHIAVYDLGAAHLIFPFEHRRRRFRMLATNGDTHLGGDDFDERVMNWIIDDFKKETGADLKKQPDALQRIKEESEKPKSRSPARWNTRSTAFHYADASGRSISSRNDARETRKLCDELIERTFRLWKRVCATARSISRKWMNWYSSAV